MSKIATSKGIYDVDILSGAANAQGEVYIICPICTPGRKPEHKRDKLLAFNTRKDPVPWRCNHCEEKGYVLTDEYLHRLKIKPLMRNIEYLALSDPLVQWFWDIRRISIQTLRDFDISMSQESLMQRRVTKANEHTRGQFATRKCINFKYKRENLLVNIKFRDNDKNFKLIPGASIIPYNIDSIKHSKVCVIVEGEPDCMAYHEAGIKCVVSVPNGVAISEEERTLYEKTGKMEVINSINLEYLDLTFDDFKYIEQFYIATDDDPPGVKLREELARRLGYEKCKYVKFGDYKDEEGKPMKDANELLVNRGKSVLAGTLDTAYSFPIADVTNANEYVDLLLKNYRDGKSKGISTGYESLDPFFNWVRGWPIVVNGFPNMGKALDIEIDIPTPTGFIKMKDLKIGDLVYDENGNPCNVIFATEIMYNRPCYEIEFSDHTKIKCDEEHLWFVYDKEARNSRARHSKRKPRTSGTTGLCQDYLMIQPKTVNTKYIYENILASKDGNKRNFSIDCTLPVQNTEKALDIHPYILGLWLGDGNTDSASITIGNEDSEELLDEINALGYSLNKRETIYMYGMPGIIQYLRNYDLIGNKHIPNIYFTSSIKQRIMLLQGLLDTDGTISNEGRIELSLSDEKLAYDAHALISSLGIDASINKNRSYLNGESKKDRYRIGFFTDLKVFKLKRKASKLRSTLQLRHKYRTIQSCKKIDSIPVKCIQVDSPSKLYLASKSYIPTHNTSLVLNLMAISAVKYDWKWGIYCPENYPVENVIEILSMILIGKTLETGYEKRITEGELILVVRDFISKHFFFVDREDGFTPEDLRKIKKQMVQQYGIVGFLTDPWSSLNHNVANEGDEYLQRELNHEVRLTTKYNLINIICHHPRTPKSKAEAGVPPTVFELNGGKYWWIKVYAALTVHQESFDDWKNNLVGFHVQKIKDKQRAGDTTSATNYPILRYDKLSRRFYEAEDLSAESKKYSKFPFKTYMDAIQATIFEGF